MSAKDRPAPHERVLPPIEVDGPHAGQHLVPEDRAFIRCPGCGHAAFRRDDPAIDVWVCGCPRGRCHGPRQVADEHGVPQLVYGDYIVRAFGGLPPQAP